MNKHVDDTLFNLPDPEADFRRYEGHPDFGTVEDKTFKIGRWRISGFAVAFGSYAIFLLIAGYIAGANLGWW